MFAAFALSLAGAAFAKTPHAQVEEMARWWTGAHSNERQATAETAPRWPEETQTARDMRVWRVDAPAIGPVVLFLEESKADDPGRVHRQRVHSLVWDEARKQVRVEQLFFKTGPTYDRAPKDPSRVAGMTRADFDHVARCDLYFSYDAARERYKGGMDARACTYTHEVSGPVYAEFDQIIAANDLWYRDRSIKVPSNDIRGEIDGFGWLRFERISDAPVLTNGDRYARSVMQRRLPGLMRQEGVWEGMFRRYDDKGVLIDAIPTRINVKFLGDGESADYEQTNTEMPVGGRQSSIRSTGKFDVDRLRFSNPRVEGWAMDCACDPSGRTTVLYLKYKDGSGMEAYEIFTLNEDFTKRQRMTQYIINGATVRRTLIDERRVE
jgi:hypothetical protein